MCKVNFSCKVEKAALDGFKKLVERHEYFFNDVLEKSLYLIVEMESDCSGGFDCVFEGLEKKKYIKKLNAKGYYKKDRTDGI